MATKTTRKFNAMEEFELDEISGVDFPAQPGARATLMKRAAEDPEFAKGLRLLSNVDGHTHLIDLGERGGKTTHDHADGEEMGHSHPWVHNDDGSVTIGMADGHTHEVLMKRDLSLESAGSGGGQHRGDNPMTKVEEKTAGADEAVEKRLAEAEARAQRAEQVSELPDVQKAHYVGLDESGRESFLKLDAKARQGEIEKGQGEDPVVYTCDDGTAIRKSAGALAEKQARDNDELRQELQVEKAARRNSTFEKRATDELGNLKGKQTAKVSLLKAIDGLSADDQKEVSEMLASANSNLAKAFGELGTREGEVVVGKGEAEAKLDELAKKRADASGGKESFAKAYTAVIKSDEGRELYREVRSNS